MTGFTFDYDRIAMVFDEEKPGGEYGSIYSGAVVTVSVDELRHMRINAMYDDVDAEDQELFEAWRAQQGFVDPPPGTWIEEQEAAEDDWWATRDTDRDQRLRAAVRARVGDLWVTEVACGCSKGRSGHLHWMHLDDDGNVTCNKGYGSVIGWRAWTVDELVDAVIDREFERKPEPVAAGG